MSEGGARSGSCPQEKRLTDALNDKKGALLYWYGMVV